MTTAQKLKWDGLQREGYEFFEQYKKKQGIRLKNGFVYRKDGVESELFSSREKMINSIVAPWEKAEIIDDVRDVHPITGELLDIE